MALPGWRLGLTSVINLLRLLQQGEDWTLIGPENFVQRTEPVRRLDPHTHEYQLGEKETPACKKLTARPACESNNYTHYRPAKKKTEWSSASLQNKKRIGEKICIGNVCKFYQN